MTVRFNNSVDDYLFRPFINGLIQNCKTKDTVHIGNYAGFIYYLLRLRSQVEDATSVIPAKNLFRMTGRQYSESSWKGFIINTQHFRKSIRAIGLVKFVHFPGRELKRTKCVRLHSNIRNVRIIV